MGVKAAGFSGRKDGHPDGQAFHVGLHAGRDQNLQLPPVRSRGQETFGFAGPGDDHISLLVDLRK
jgi:hypothetical protein